MNADSKVAFLPSNCIWLGLKSDSQFSIQGVETAKRRICSFISICSPDGGFESASRVQQKPRAESRDLRPVPGYINLHSYSKGSLTDIP